MMIPAIPTTADEAIAALHALPSIHPEDSAASIVTHGGARLFTDEEAPRVDAVMDAVWDLLGDSVWEHVR